MNFRLVLLLWLLNYSSAQDANRYFNESNRIVNGFPMMAGLVNLRLYGSHSCGASILSNRIVLTAAHCVDSESPFNFRVVVGLPTSNVSNVDPNTWTYAISRFTIHPSFTTVNYDNNIAVVWVAEAAGIQFNDRVQPVCLPFRYADNDFAGTKVAIPGWGTIYPGGPKSNVLLKADVDVLQQSSCWSKGAPVTDRQMCTWTSGTDPCQDDSGSPLLWTDPSTGLLHIVGIISSRSFCASDIPGINTRVTAFLNWILSVTSTNINDYCV